MPIGCRTKAYRRPISGGGVSETIFGTLAPAGAEDNPSFQDLGVIFTVSVPGTITHLRFFRDAGENAGTYTGRLWNASTSTLLATVTFSNNTGSGWRQEALSTPIAVTSGVNYLVSVTPTSPLRFFAYTGAYLSTARTSAGGRVTAIANGARSSASAGTIPATPFSSHNCFRDVVFVPS